MIFIQEKYCDCCGAWYKFESVGSPNSSEHCPTCGGNGRDLFILGTVETGNKFFNAFLYNGYYMNWAVASLGHTLVTAGTFFIPPDFDSILSIKLILIPGATANDVNIAFTGYSAGNGEDSQIHKEFDISKLFDLTEGALQELDVTSLFPDIVAGAYCSLEVENLTGNNINLIGMKIEYKINKNSYNGS